MLSVVSAGGGKLRLGYHLERVNPKWGVRWRGYSNLDFVSAGEVNLDMEDD